jgi:hypothetical protein
MAYKTNIFKLVDKYPLVAGAAFVIGFPLLADMVLDRTRIKGIRGIGNVWTDSRSEIQQSGSTAPLNNMGTNNDNGIMSGPSMGPVRYDAEYHTRAWMDEPLNVKRNNRPRVVPASVRHGYEPMVFAGLAGVDRL